MHPKLLYNKHHLAILAKASQKLGLIKRNCSITTCKNARKTLYISLVQSLFEHCSQIWRPTTATQIQKFENLQKRAVKWVLNETYCRTHTRLAISYLVNTGVTSQVSPCRTKALLVAIPVELLFVHLSPNQS